MGRGQTVEKRAGKRELGPSEPVWYLRGLPYHAYLQTRHWRRRSAEFRENARDECGLCGLDEWTAGRRDGEIADWVRFHVHHVSYDRLGYERNEDLILLCPPCHNLVHRPDSHAAQHWLRYHGGGVEDAELADRALALSPPEFAR